VNQRQTNRRHFIKQASVTLAAVGVAGTARATAPGDDRALETARAIEALVAATPYDFITHTVVDMINETADRLDIPPPEDWLLADRRGEGVAELAAFLRRVPALFSLRGAPDEGEAAQLTREVLAVLADESDPRRDAVHTTLLDLCLEVDADLNDAEVLQVAARVGIREALEIAAEVVPDNDEAMAAWLEANPRCYRPWMSQANLDALRAALKGGAR